MIDPRTVDHVARLARLDLKEDEKTRFFTELKAILEYMDTLNEVSTNDDKPFEHRRVNGSPLREDIPGNPLERDKAMENAPEQEKGFYRVPPPFERDTVPEEG